MILSKYLIYLFFISLLSICFVQCGDDDIDEEEETYVNFTAQNEDNNRITISCGDCIIFEDESTGIISRTEWIFEGGDPDRVVTDGNVVQVSTCYDRPGKYDVTLIVRGDSGDIMHKKESYVCVNPKEDLNADFYADTVQTIEGIEVRFFDSSTGNPTNWEWSGTNGTDEIESAIQNPFFTFTPGKWNISLAVRNDLAESTEIKEEYMDVKSFEDFVCNVNREISDNGTERIFTYDGDDRLDRVEEFVNGGLNRRISYDWSGGNLLKATYTNAQDQVVQREEYEYGTLGLSAQTLFDSTGFSLRYDFNYNNDKIIEGAQLTVTQGNNIQLGNAFYSYDDDFKNITEEEIQFQGNTFSKVKLEYDNNPSLFGNIGIGQYLDRSNSNNVISREDINQFNELIGSQKFKFTYNEFGRPAELKRTDEFSGDATTSEFIIGCRIQFN